MSSIRLLGYGYFILFFFTLIVNFFFLNNNFSWSSLAISLFVALPSTVYVLLRCFSPKTQQFVRRGTFTTFTPLAILFLAAVIFISFLLVDIEDLRISRNIFREQTLYNRILALHIVLTSLTILYAYSLKKMTTLSKLLIVIAFSFSFMIAIIEGRRTSIAIPIILLGLFELIRGKSKRNLFLIIIFATILFSSITLTRYGSIDTSLFVELLAKRIFNTGQVFLVVVESGDYGFNPEVVSKSFERILYTLGLSEYTSLTNDFGRYYQLLSPTIFYVNINPGILVELYLTFGWLYLFPLIIIIELCIFTMNLYRKLFYQSDLLVGVLILHGMQMETPYLIGLLFKLIVLGFLLYLISIIMPKSLTDSELNN